MARKPAARTARPSVVKKSDTEAVMVRVRITRSFEYWVIGEEFHTSLTERVLALVSGGFMEVIDHGTGEAGPGATGTGDQGGEPESLAPESSAGAEPGEDPRAG